MEKQSIRVLKELLAAGELDDQKVCELKSDTRKGVQQLVKAYEREKQTELQLENKFHEMGLYERKARAAGKRYIAGIDEAGRGPLAGPLVAAAVILPENFKLLGLNDSKQLTESSRTVFCEMIKEQAVSYGISIISNEEIDKINVHEAAKQAMVEAVSQLEPAPDHLLIDAMELEGYLYSSESLVKGDSKSISIAAASVLAKVTRDEKMRELHKQYPMYDFASNMGYGTKHHMKALQEHGSTPFHRRSFAPVKDLNG
ncbi:ribonuclease HII [Virgibacillus xinjiangensis]|uniref:Ribonuclease HII n=1 Tax=Virgibacillus xinjiangensis TaxID=393090 RepID=A0ABV7CVH0_9BACI